MENKNESTRIRQLFKKAISVIDCSVDSLAFLAGILIIVIMLLVTAAVVIRTITGNSILWVVEITEFSLLWITFLGTAWVLKKEGHVKMDMILNRFSKKNQARLNIITSFVAAIICLVVACAAVLTIYDKFNIGSATHGYLMWPYYLILSVIPLGCFFLFFQFLRRAFGYSSDFKTMNMK